MTRTRKRPAPRLDALAGVSFVEGYSSVGFIAAEPPSMSATPHEHDVAIGKFDILATYTYAKELAHGLDDLEARQRGMVAAIMGAAGPPGIDAGLCGREDRG
jgi:hypothetical protein